MVKFKAQVIAFILNHSLTVQMVTNPTQPNYASVKELVNRPEPSVTVVQTYKTTNRQINEVDSLKCSHLNSPFPRYVRDQESDPITFFAVHLKKLAGKVAGMRSVLFLAAIATTGSTSRLAGRVCHFSEDGLHSKSASRHEPLWNSQWKVGSGLEWSTMQGTCRDPQSIDGFFKIGLAKIVKGSSDLNNNYYKITHLLEL